MTVWWSLTGLVFAIAHDGRETAGGRRGRARGNRFPVLEARLAQVNVEVDETGKHEKPGRVEDLGFAGGEIRADPGDLPVFDEHVENRVSPVSRIDDAPSPDQHAHAFHVWGFPPASR